MITFIIPCSDVACYGVRIISSYLKVNNYNTQIVFLPVKRNRFDTIYSNRVLNQLAEVTRDSELIGLSVMTNYLLYAQQITKALKEKTKTHIIWGGIHPTIAPQDCIQYADIVCIGEGEEPMIELANSLKQGQFDYSIKNLWFKSDNRIIKNDVRPLVQDLNKFPMADYDISSHFILNKKGEIDLMSERSLRDNFQYIDITLKKKNISLSRYAVFTSRGCPHSCSFCCNSYLKNLYKNKGRFIRKRNIELVIKEIEYIKEKFNFDVVGIQDENFFVRTEEEIRNFAMKYKTRVNLPLQVEFSPQLFSQRKAEILIDAGLTAVHMGIQSACRKTNVEIYNRTFSIEHISSILNFLDTQRVKAFLHFIIFNPWEEPQSLIETINFAILLPCNFTLILFPLVFYPGTELYERAKKEGYIKDYYNDIVLKGGGIERLKGANYLILCFYALTFLRRSGVDKNTTKRLTQFFVNQRMVRLLDRKFIIKPVTYLLPYVIILLWKFFKPLKSYINMQRRKDILKTIII